MDQMIAEAEDAADAPKVFIGNNSGSVFLVGDSDKDAAINDDDETIDDETTNYCNNPVVEREQGAESDDIRGGARYCP
jgi:hypothetical protein